MNLDNLNAFLAIVDAESFSGAAQQLHITQPAISKRIRQLECELDCLLFERGSKQVALTEAGRKLLPHARTVLLEVQNARDSIAHLNTRVGGRLGIIVSHHVGLHRLPRILNRYIARYPEVDLQLRFLESEKATEELYRHDAELAFITLPRQQDDKLQLHLSWPDPMAFVCGPGHPLASATQTTPVTLELLASHQAVLPASTTTTYQLIRQLFDEHKLALTASIPTNDLETIKMMVSVGIGWSVLPRTMLDQAVIHLPVQAHPPCRYLGAVSVKRKTLGNAARAFIHEARAVWGENKPVIAG